VSTAGLRRGPTKGRCDDRIPHPLGPPAGCGFADDGGQVAGAGQVPFGDRGGQDLSGVQAGQFGGAQGPPQPPRLVAKWPTVAGRQAGRDNVLVALLAGGRGLGGPDRVQDREVIGTGQGAVPVLSRG
jgi:hypothetical protein